MSGLDNREVKSSVLGNNEYPVQSAAQVISPGASQKITFSGTSSASAAVVGSVVKLFATKDCWCVIGADPTAAADDGSSFFMPGGTFDYFVIDQGEKIAVIQDSAAGDLHILEAENA